MSRVKLAALFALAACVQAPAQLKIVWQHPANNQCVAFSPNSALLASGGGGASIWYTANGNLFETLIARFPDSRGIAFSPDGVYVAGGSHSFNQNLNLWRVSDGSIVHERITAHNNGVEAVQFSPNGQLLATCGRDGYTKLWTVPDLVLVNSIPSGRRTFSLAFSPNGARIVTGGQYGVKVWDVSTGGLLLTLDGNFTNVQGVAYSPDGRLIAAGYDVIGASGESVDSAIRIWRATDGVLIRTLTAATTYGTYTVAFSSGSDYIAAGGDSRRDDPLTGSVIYEGYFRIWRVHDGALLTNVPLEDPERIGMGAVLSIAYSPSRAYIAFTRLDGLLTVIRDPFPSSDPASSRPTLLSRALSF